MQRPAKTFADYLVVAISPVLIMLLVGSLAFFLIQIFYQSEMVHALRWVMFWFVLAIVLVSRIGLEQSKEHATGYGVALAAVTCIYLWYSQRAPIVGMILLGITWWCAHVLTVDCTLIDDNQDASGEGILQGMWRRWEDSIEPRPMPPPLPPPRVPGQKLPPIEQLVAENIAKRRRQAPPRKPGKYVIYFSLAALPLFGLGQLLLPADDLPARHAGFIFLAVYLTAALSLLMTTSFLGLRRYLRQRSVEMSTSIALGWVRFGIILTALVLLAAVVLPRPGATSTWKTFAHQISPKPHKASPHALPFNPPGEGDGAPADEPKQSGHATQDSPKSASGSGPHPQHDSSASQSQSPSDSSHASQSGGGNGKSSGNGGTGQPGDEGEQTGSGKNIRVKDTTPNGSAEEEPGKKDPPAESDGEPNAKDGPGGKIGLDGKPNSQRVDSPKNPPKKDSPKPPAISPPQQKPLEQPPEPPPGNDQPRKPDFRSLFRILIFLALAALLVWAVIRYREAIARAFRKSVEAVREFFRKLFGFRKRKPAVSAGELPPTPVLEPFAAYENPFITGRDKAWASNKLVLYTYEAVLAWAKEHGIEVRPQETPREFCARLGELFPDLATELECFSVYYCYAAFAEELPEDFETGSIRRLWEYLGDSVAVATR